MIIGGDLVNAPRAQTQRRSELGSQQLVGGYRVERLFTGSMCGVRLWVSETAAGLPDMKQAAQDAVPCPASLCGSWPLTGDQELTADVSGCGRHAVVRFIQVAGVHRSGVDQPGAYAARGIVFGPAAGVRDAMTASVNGMNLFGAAKLSPTVRCGLPLGQAHSRNHT